MKKKLIQEYEATNEWHQTTTKKVLEERLIDPTREELSEIFDDMPGQAVYITEPETTTDNDESNNR